MNIIFPKDFIQETLINRIRDIVFRHPYLSFTLIAIGIEFLGKCMLSECKNWNIKPNKAFKKGIELLKQADIRYSTIDLKDQLRNGFVHTLSPKSKIKLAEARSGSTHFEQVEGRTVLVIEILYRDFVKACHTVLKTNFSKDDKMNKSFTVVK